MHKTHFLFALTAAIAPAIGNGQRSDTILQNLLVNSAATGATGIISNIGQSQHRAVVHLSNAPSLTCSPQNVDMVFQASVDAGTTWFEIGTPLTSIPVDNSGNLIALIEADGGYPSLRFMVNAFNTTNCRLRVDYSGTLFPNPAAAGVVPAYNARGMRTVDITLNFAGAESRTAFTNSSANRFVSVYGLFLTSDAAVTLTIGHAAGIVMAAGEKINIPNTGVVQFVLNRGENFVITSSAATNVRGWVVLRQEDNP